MRKKCFFILRFLIASLVIVISVTGTNQILQYKSLMADGHSIASTMQNFYALDKDSADVIFLGSSHSMYSFIPQELYNQYGITSYNLSSGVQPSILSYYLLKEALKTQSPDVVVMDVFVLFPVLDLDEPLNTQRTNVRSVVDNMKWDSVKIDLIHDICAYDSSFDMLSFILPNIEYHSRWDELEIDDFLYRIRASIPNLYGYKMSSGEYGDGEEYLPLQEDRSAPAEDMHSVMKIYMDRIVALCRDQEIDLVLVKTPDNSFTIGKHNAIQQYAEENDIAFIDFNEETLYNEIQYDFSSDNIDYGHANHTGALKLTTYIGSVLQQQYQLEAHYDSAMESSKETYEIYSQDYYLTTIDDFTEYLSVLAENSDRYTIFISAQDDASGSIDDTARELLSGLGLSVDWSDAYRKSYCAVVESGNVILEEMSDDALKYSGTILDGAHSYSIQSAGFSAGNYSSIKIDSPPGDSEDSVTAENELSKGSRGLNFVVYNNSRMTVIDSVCFDTYDSAWTATR